MPAGRGLSPILALLIAAWLGGVVFAQEPPSNEAPATGEEMFRAGLAAFRAGNWEKAEGHFTEFLAAYQGEEEAKLALAEASSLKALCLLRGRKFAEASQAIDAALAIREIRPEWRNELAFWKGVCQYQAADVAAGQESFLAYFKAADRRDPRRHEAAILFGAGYLMLEQYEAATVFLAEAETQLRQESTEAASRLVLLHLHALLKWGNLDQALALVRHESPRLESFRQMVSLQSLVLELGSRLLDEGRYPEAIQCLRNVWPKDRVIAFQKEKLREMERQLRALKARGDQDALVFQVEGALGRARRELEHFEKVADYDAAARLRLARSFIGHQRFREAALVMEDMLERLPQSALVESAILPLMECWLRVERWPEVVEVADKYFGRFGWETPSAPATLFLKGDALQRDHRYEEAFQTFGQMTERFPQAPLAQTARFMQGICRLHADDNAAAREIFGQVLAAKPEPALAENALYWTAMAHSFAGEHEEALAVAEKTLADYPQGAHLADAEFRAAFSLHALARHEDAIPRFRAFLTEHDESAQVDEARLLLGDSLLAMGELDAGIAAYREIPPTARAFFEDAYFKIGKALRLAERHDEMTSHFEAFVREHPSSNRVAEAVHWLGWNEERLGRAEAARERYWHAIRRLGDQPEHFAVEDLIEALAKLHRQPNDREALLSRWREERETARKSNRATLALRARWAETRLLRTDRPNLATRLLAETANEIDFRKHRPRIIADVAEALLEGGSADRARELFAGLRQWHPRALERDRAELGLAKLDMRAGRLAEARASLEKLAKRETGVLLAGEVMMTKAECLEREGRTGDALADYETLLSSKTTTSEFKAQALLKAARLQARQGRHDAALAFFERVYLAYGKHADQVAAAYWERGQMLENLAKKDEAREVYQALLARPELAEKKEARAARERLRAWEGGQG